MVIAREITIYEEGCDETSNCYVILTYQFKNGIKLYVKGNDDMLVCDMAIDKINELYNMELVSFMMESPYITKYYINVDKCLEEFIMLSVGFRNELRSDYDDNVDETINELISEVMEFYDINEIEGVRDGEEFKRNHIKYLEDEDCEADNYEWNINASGFSVDEYAREYDDDDDYE